MDKSFFIYISVYENLKGNYIYEIWKEQLGQWQRKLLQKQFWWFFPLNVIYLKSEETTLKLKPFIQY